MKILKAKFDVNEKGRPQQPDKSSLNNLYHYAEAFISDVFSYSLEFLVNKFNEENKKKSVSFKIPDIKSYERAKEKLDEEDIGLPRNILDIVRGSVSFSKAEDLLDFVKFTIEYQFTEKDFDKFIFKTLMHDLPTANVYITNSFNFNLEHKDKKKYKDLLSNLDLKPKNYMDLKFYMYIPFPSMEKGANEYMICEIIANLEDFNKVSDKTHNLYEISRSFKTKKGDDIDPRSLSKAIEEMIRNIYVEDVIIPYNEKNSNGIKIKPHEYSEETKYKQIEKVFSSKTFLNSIARTR